MNWIQYPINLGNVLCSFLRLKEYWKTRSLGALRAPTSSLRPSSGLFDFVLRALQALRPCDGVGCAYGLLLLFFVQFLVTILISEWLTWVGGAVRGVGHLFAGCKIDQLCPFVSEVVGVPGFAQVNHPGHVRSVQAANADGSIQQEMDPRHLQELTRPDQRHLESANWQRDMSGFLSIENWW